ncbi:MAG: DUF4920 domain-containing protein [Bacteroidetes bacterium]|nr:DUF4920 domain-containing protein [Bacteroidota bacterium]MBL0097728.1 DUF4920 domain-containing protein [Bacteroidota bacterium]
MKKLFFLGVIAVALSSCSQTANNENNEANGDSTATTLLQFGAKIDEAGAISMDSLLAMVNAGNGDISGVKVEGKVNEVCQAKGCWMQLDKGDGTTMRVTFKDYGFFVPKDCGGKSAIILGHAYMDTTAVEDLRHYAEDAGKSKEEIEKITEPEVELAFEAEGVLIK